MKYKILLPFAFVFLMSCSKKSELQFLNPGVPPENGFEVYTISKDEQYCDKNRFQGFKGDQLTYVVKFDSSAIYQTKNAANQSDINKLFGFSDNNTTHQQYSARFGWRWSNDSLRLFGYTYNAGVRSFKELGVVHIGGENTCSIIAESNKYVFLLNGSRVEMPRNASTTSAEGYLLWPYFGGDETAPHVMHIYMKKVVQN